MDKIPTSHKEEAVKSKLNIDDAENLLKADKPTKQKMENIFRALDVNRKGEIDRTSLGVAFKKLGLGLSDDEVDAIMSDIDINSDGDIEFQEFEDWFLQQDPVAIFLDAQYEVYAKKRIELGRRIFKAIDSNRLGVVDCELLRRAFENVFDMGLKDDEVDKVMIEINNKSGGTTIDQATFETWFLETNPVARLLETQYNNIVVKRRREMSRNIFAAIDFKNRGNIDISTLRKAFKAFKIGIENEQIVNVMRELINNAETPIDTAMVSPRQFETWFLEQTKIGLMLQKRVEEVFHNDTTQVDNNGQKKNLKMVKKNQKKLWFKIALGRTTSEDYQIDKAIK